MKYVLAMPNTYKLRLWKYIGKPLSISTSGMLSL